MLRRSDRVLRLELMRWRRLPRSGPKWLFQGRSCTPVSEISEFATSCSSRLPRHLLFAAELSSNAVSSESRSVSNGKDCVGLMMPLVTCTSALGRQLSTATSGSSIVEPAATWDASTSAEAQSPPSPSASDLSSPSTPSTGRRLLSRSLKAGIGLSTLTACAAAGYATYAYGTDEVEENLKQLQSEWLPMASSSSSSSPSVEGESSGGLRESNEIFGVASAAKKAFLEAGRLYLNARRSVEEQIRGFAAPSSEKLLPDLAPEEVGIYTLVLDLDETLIFSDWKRDKGWRTFKRPGVESFLEEMSKYFEIVVYTDQINMYGDPVMARLDPKGYVRFKLYRDATQYTKGKHMRDLSKLNRDPSKVLYLSGHGLENCLDTGNVVPIKPWKAENDDSSLLDLMPFLECIARQRPFDVRAVLESYKGQDIPTAFKERTKEVQRRLQERRGHSFWQRAVTSGPKTTTAH